jgi:hypothetical protein
VWRQHEIIGHEGSIPFLGVWTSDQGVIGVYLRLKHTRFYAGRMFGRMRLERGLPYG